MSQPTVPTAQTTVPSAVPEQRTEADRTAIRAIDVNMPDDSLADLRRRLVATKLPSLELVADRAQVGPLTDPTAHGGNPEDAFDLVLPSLPGIRLLG
jgi:hypothetical protein